MAGVSSTAISKACRNSLAAACIGKRIDANHPDALAYLRDKKIKQTPPVAEGVDPAYEEALKYAKHTGDWTQEGIRLYLRVGRERAKKIVDMFKLNGLVPDASFNSCDAFWDTTGPGQRDGIRAKLRAEIDAGGADELIPHPPKRTHKHSPHLQEENTNERGPLPKANENLRQYLEWTLIDLINTFGTDALFVDWLNAVNKIETISEKRLKNETAEGRLVSRELVDRYVIGAFNECHLKLMQDGAKSIASLVIDKHLSGESIVAITAEVSDTIGAFVSQAKKKIARALDE